MRANGADVSYWQGQVNWPVLSSKVDFAFIRSTYGNRIDPEWEINASGALHSGVLWAPYHYYYLTISNNDQVTLFNNVTANKAYTLPPVVDFERNGNIGVMTKAAASAVFITFLRNLEDMIGRKPIIYSSTSALFDLVGNPDWLVEYDLWLAWYPYYPNPETQWPKLPPTADPEKCLFWQWTSRGPGRDYGVESAYIDLNVFDGTREELLQYAGTFPPTPPPFQPYQVEVTANLNIRSVPNTSHSPKGLAYQGSRWQVLEEESGWGKIAENSWFYLAYTRKV